MKKINVLFAAFEAAPFIKTGGLGDVAAALPGAVQCPTIDIRVVLPKLRQIPEEYKREMKWLCSFEVPVSWRKQYCGLFELRRGGVTWYFLDNEFYFYRDSAYGCMDDGERMAFFSRAICECCQYLPDFFPDILHCNDWHTASACVLLREFYQNRAGYADIKTVFTIHNLKFQGIYDPFCLGDLLGLHDCAAAKSQMIFNGNLNYLAGAANYADRITTVSPTYAGEICTDYFGENLQSIFRRRRNVLSGILNGIDTASYNPATDVNIVKRFTTPEEKVANKIALQAELGLEENPDVPLCVVVSRLTEQKGFDLMTVVDEEMLQNCQIAVLGTGNPQYENHFRALEKSHPGRASAQIYFSEELSRRFYAGADMFLMPSRFEPCGLSQMIAMRYGTLPVVRQTGGLADSVKPYNRYTGEGTGFGFSNYNAHEFLFTVRAACRLFQEDKETWLNLQRQAMSEDFSWKASAAKYRSLYRSLCK